MNAIPRTLSAWHVTEPVTRWCQKDVKFSRGVEMIDWSVFDEINLRDHAYSYVSFAIEPQSTAQRFENTKATDHTSWILKQINFDAFYNFFNTFLEALKNYIYNACDLCQCRIVLKALWENGRCTGGRTTYLNSGLILSPYVGLTIRVSEGTELEISKQPETTSQQPTGAFA
ncbi:hypothetical protein AGLY_008751 [Aphis glycines]|uniref:Uncharacterized protein n=1 Tax=Aphis glycines TaxID=307491 RepID=A0A6G0TKC5_APHGL|nr:hypothetical protein AGLY_008751 [Aphis glycines]